jgi:CDP-glucose 4,6-dehydratase
MAFANAFRDKSVWLSGSTGFKGGWLAWWLHSLGARVTGFALEPDQPEGIFRALGLDRGRAPNFSQTIADVRDAGAVRKSIEAAQPDFVFHLAAQPLVRLSYEQPLETYATNVMGTANVLESLRALKKTCAAVMVTTDKCYENKHWLHGYREEDPLGGHDPYSSSKACAEILVSAWRRSFFKGHPVRIASARAGNVIGGGDWALDRIVPDCVRALRAGAAIPIRNRQATRPWQHVLEPLSGYLWLAAVLASPNLRPYDKALYDSAFNFGPTTDSNRTVAELVQEILKHSPGRWEDKSDPNAVHEASLLHLSIDKAHHLLGWQPVWNFEQTIARTMEWYRFSETKGSLTDFTSEQIAAYESDARQKGFAIQLRN